MAYIYRFLYEPSPNRLTIFVVFFPPLNFRYHSVEYNCLTGLATDMLINATVQLTDDVEKEASNAMRLHTNIREELRHNFTVCLERPLFGDVPPDWFIEWMEANAVFGAEEVLIHNLSMPDYLDPYVNFYKERGVLTVLPWDLNMDYDLTHCHIQLSMIYDCVYRLRKYSRYAVFIDLDELIVPRYSTDATWSEMMQRANCSHPHSYGARQLLFNMKFDQVDNTSLITQDFKIRHFSLTEYRKRSKYIAHLKQVTQLSIHFASKTPINSTCVLPSEIGALHHYREKKATSHQIVRDDAMVKYKEELMERTKRTKEQVLILSGNYT